MYGTHYMSEGSLGGEYQALIELDRQDFSSTRKNSSLDLEIIDYTVDIWNIQRQNECELIIK